MEVSRRDILVSLVAVLILLAVLLPSLLVVKNYNLDEDLAADPPSIEINVTTPISTTATNNNTTVVDDTESKDIAGVTQTVDEIVITTEAERDFEKEETTLFEIRNPR